MPAVRSPNWAGRVPVKSVTDWISSRVHLLAEAVEPFRQKHAVDAVLDVAVVAADVDFAKFLLDHPGRLQQHLLKGSVLALAHHLNLIRVDRIRYGPQTGRNFFARLVQISVHSQGGHYNGRRIIRRTLGRG